MGLWNDLLSGLQEHGIAPHLVIRLFWTIAIWATYFILHISVGRLIDRRITDMSRSYVAKKTTRYVLGFAVVIGTLAVWFGNGTGWAAYLGILSAGLAIALQDPVTNLAGWVFLMVRKPFVIGDRIQIGEHRGDVIDIRLFQFSLIEIGNWVSADQSTGRIIHLPNGWTFRHSIANYTAEFNFIWNELPITVTFESDWKKAKAILAEIANRHAILKSKEAEEQVRRAARKYLIYYQYLTPIVWTSVVDNGVTLTLRYICEPRRRRSSEVAIWEDVLTAFAAEDSIDFAYPTTRFYNNVIEGKPEARAQIPPASHDP